MFGAMSVSHLYAHHLTSLIRTTSLINVVRATTSCFPSGEKAYLEIPGEVKLVNWRGSLPSKGCSHKFTTLSRFHKNVNVLPSGVHWYAPKALKVLIG